VGVSRDGPNLLSTPIVSGTGKATNFKFGTCIHRVHARDGNRTEPEPNAPNSNPCFLQKRTEPNELRDLPNRTEPELCTMGSVPTGVHYIAFALCICFIYQTTSTSLKN